MHACIAQAVPCNPEMKIPIIPSTNTIHLQQSSGFLERRGHSWVGQGRRGGPRIGEQLPLAHQRLRRNFPSLP